MARSGRIKKTGYFDYGMVFVIVLLLAFGMVMLYSTSSYTASLRLGDSAYFVKRQAVFSIIGLGAMYVVSRIDYHFWARIRFRFSLLRLPKLLSLFSSRPYLPRLALSWEIFA